MGRCETGTPYYDDGQIQIWHGDCRDVLPTIKARSVDVVLTDPPYGIALDMDFRRIVNEFGQTGREYADVIGDDAPFDPLPLLAFGRCILFGGNYFADRLPMGKWIVWNKRDSMKTERILSDAELIWHNCGGMPVRVFNWFWNGAYRTGEMGSFLHPNQKPVALMRWLIEQFTKPGDLVLDPYAGSGPIPEACKQAGRRCIAVEIEETYCATAARRLQQAVLPLAMAGD
jgi:site-specific DNA-methyltransferase (adenine-specific)